MSRIKKLRIKWGEFQNYIQHLSVMVRLYFNVVINKIKGVINHPILRTLFELFVVWCSGCSLYLLWGDVQKLFN